MHPASSRAFAGLLAAGLFSPLPQLFAQTSPPPSHSEPVWVASDSRDNPSPVEGVVWSDFATAPAGTPWVRLHFRSVSLPKGSYLRLVSVRDGDVMTMRQEHMVQWNHSSAYFNGNSATKCLISCIAWLATPSAEEFRMSDALEGAEMKIETGNS